MKNTDVIRAWKDREYRLGLSKADQALLPEHPVGLVELTDAELGGASGGFWSIIGGLSIARCGVSVVNVCTVDRTC
jgi:mersacidin/lichenicidin family type 2 lantibiotic